MALTYDYTQVKDSSEVMFDADDFMRADTQSIIFATMSVGMGHITNDNFFEFVTRLRVCEKLRGWDEISTERIRQHIGLSTNVPFESRTSWLKRWLDYEMDDIKRKVMNECDTLLAS